jgi:hypothetical protein
MARVAGIRRIEPVKRRPEVAEASGFNRDSVTQQAQTVPDEIVDDFLRALGFNRRFIAAPELISAEVLTIAASVGTDRKAGTRRRRK